MTHAAHLALGPLILAQGLVVRWRIPKLPEASGPRQGTAGQGAELRLLVAGDSAAAGVGATTQDEALAGRIVEALAPEFRVAWRVEAATGATTRDTLARERLGVSFLVISGLPPLGGFPSLPEPLRGFMGSRARSWSAALEQELHGEPDARYLDLTSMLAVEHLATDGFHPGPGIYANWGARAARVIGVERAAGR